MDLINLTYILYGVIFIVIILFIISWFIEDKHWMDKKP